MAFPVVARRWGPWGDLLSLQDEMNRLFETTMGGNPRVGLLGSEYVPPADILRDKDNIVVRMDVPGLKKDDLDLTILNGRLFVRGEKKHDEEQNEQNVHRRERFYGSFERVIDLPSPVDADNIRAKFDNGVLEITAPVRPESKPRQIAIDVQS
jgi:HSP20 family protein